MSLDKTKTGCVEAITEGAPGVADLGAVADDERLDLRVLELDDRQPVLPHDAHHPEHVAGRDQHLVLAWDRREHTDVDRVLRVDDEDGPRVGVPQEILDHGHF